MICGLVWLDEIINFLGASKALHYYCKEYLEILFLFVPANILQTLFSNLFVSAMFTALSNGKVSAMLSFIRTFIFLAGGILFWPYIFSNIGIWIAVPIAEGLTFIVSIRSLLRNRKNIFMKGFYMNIQIFGTTKCFDTKKAQRYFKERGVKFQFVDLKEKGLSKGEFNSVKQAVGSLDKMLNPKCKDKDALAMIRYIAEEDKVEKVLENQQVLLTPIVRNGKMATVGYQPDVWKNW